MEEKEKPKTVVITLRNARHNYTLIDKCYATKMSTMSAYQCVYSHRTICDKFDDYEGKIAFRSIHQLIVVIWRTDNRSLHLVQLSFSDDVVVVFCSLCKIQKFAYFYCGFSSSFFFGELSYIDAYIEIYMDEYIDSWMSRFPHQLHLLMQNVQENVHKKKQEKERREYQPNQVMKYCWSWSLQRISIKSSPLSQWNW